MVNPCNPRDPQKPAPATTGNLLPCLWERVFAGTGAGQQNFARGRPVPITNGDSSSWIGFSHFRFLQFDSSLCFVIRSVLLEGLPIIGNFPLFCRHCLQSGEIGSISVLVLISLNWVVCSFLGVFVFENCP